MKIREDIELAKVLEDGMRKILSSLSSFPSLVDLVISTLSHKSGRYLLKGILDFEFSRESYSNSMTRLESYSNSMTRLESYSIKTRLENRLVKNTLSLRLSQIMYQNTRIKCLIKTRGRFDSYTVSTQKRLSALFSTLKLGHTLIKYLINNVKQTIQLICYQEKLILKIIVKSFKRAERNWAERNWKSWIGLDFVTKKSKKIKIIHAKSKISSEENKINIRVIELNEIKHCLSLEKEQIIQAKNEMVSANFLLVFKISKKYKKSSGMQLIDLIQSGNIGLIKAVENYSYRSGKTFETYAYWWIRQAITQAFAITLSSTKALCN